MRVPSDAVAARRDNAAVFIRSPTSKALGCDPNDKESKAEPDFPTWSVLAYKVILQSSSSAIRRTIIVGKSPVSAEPQPQVDVRTLRRRSPIVTASHTENDMSEGSGAEARL